MSLREKIREATAPQEVAPHIDCAYGGCIHPATIRVRQGQARGNVCREHYDRYHVAMARRYLHEHGCKTREERMALLRQLAHSAPPEVRRAIQKEAA